MRLINLGPICAIKIKTKKKFIILSYHNSSPFRERILFNYSKSAQINSIVISLVFDPSFQRPTSVTHCLVLAGLKLLHFHECLMKH